MFPSPLCVRAAITLIATAGTVVTLAAPAYAAAKDTTPPPAPTHLSIDGKTTSSSGSSLTLSWTKSAASDVKGYNVYRNTKSSFSGSTRLVTLTTATSYKDAKVAPGSDYWYFVLAYDKSNNHGTPATLPVEVSVDQNDRELSTFVTDVKGTPLKNIEQDVYRGATLYTNYATTDTHGFAHTDHLPYSSGGLAVCLRTNGGGEGGVSSHGYSPVCYDGKFATDPKHATRLPLVAGEYRSVSQAMTAGGEIHGVVDLPGAIPASGVTANLYDSDGDQVGYGYSVLDDGSFDFAGVAAGSNYTIEVTADGFTGETYPDGVVDSWEGGAPGYLYQAGNARPSGVTGYTVKAGTLTSATLLTLPSGGAISGTLSNTYSGDVEIFDAAGHEANDVYTDHSGASFTSIVLPPGQYTVCGVDDNFAAVPACWDAANRTSLPWDNDPKNLPAAAQGTVAVSAGNTTSGVDLNLPSYPLLGVGITGPADHTYDFLVYDGNGNLVGSEDGLSNNTDDNFDQQLSPGTYSVCAFDDADSSDGLCWDADHRQGVTWHGDPDQIPGAAKNTVHLDYNGYVGTNFQFGG